MERQKGPGIVLIYVILILVALSVGIWYLQDRLSVSGLKTNPTPPTSAVVSDFATRGVTALQSLKTSSSTPPPTRASTATSTITLVPTRIPSPTLLPTLDDTQTESMIRQFLEENGQCSAPCLWNITPGKTTLDEMQNVFRRLQVPLFYSPGLNGKDYFSADPGINELSGSIEIVVHDKVVLNIRVWIGPENPEDQATWRSWTALTPAGLIQEYGRPSNILFFIQFPGEEGLPAGTAWYDVILIFEDKDLVADYYFQTINAGKSFPVCLETDRFEDVSIWLGKEPENLMLEGSIPLDKATSMNMDQFLELLTENGGEDCFYLNRDAFSP